MLCPSTALTHLIARSRSRVLRTQNEVRICDEIKLIRLPSETRRATWEQMSWGAVSGADGGSRRSPHYKLRIISCLHVMRAALLTTSFSSDSLSCLHVRRVAGEERRHGNARRLWTPQMCALAAHKERRRLPLAFPLLPQATRALEVPAAAPATKLSNRL